MKQIFKYLLPVISLTIAAFSARSQIITTCTITNTSCNYVTNGGFEDNNISEIIDYDPVTWDPIYGCDLLHSTGTAYKCGNSALDQDNEFHGCNWTTSGWTWPTFASADYYHACANTCWDKMSVNAFSNFTSNNIGSVSPHSGSGYAGIYVYTAADAFPAGGDAAYQESIKQSLSTTLIAGKTYVVSMWVRLSHHSKYAVSDFWINGINFTNSAITNKNGWTFLSTCYTPVTNVTEIEIGSYATTLTDLDPNNVWAPYGESSGQRNKVSYYYIDDVSITLFNVNAGPDIVSLFPGCGTQIGTTNGGFTCPPAGGMSVVHSWSPGTGLSSTGIATPIASPGVTTEYTVTTTVTYTNEAGLTSVCSSTDAVLVNVVTPTINITPSFTCNSNSISTFTANVVPTGSYTYSWTVKDAATGTVVAVAGTGTTGATPTFSMHNVTQAVNVCVSVINNYGCQSSPTCYYFPNCCPTGTNVIKYANTTYNTLTTLASLTGTNAIALGGTITVNSGGHLIINSKDVSMEPNTKIVLNGTGRITLTNDYIHGCDYMWDGIYAHTTGLVSSQLVRFEDAKRVIVDSMGTASLNIITSYFNKNNMGIVIKAAKSSSSYITIRNNLFTCSDIPKTGNVPYIPLTANLTNAPTLGAYATTNLQEPYNTLKSYCGIQMLNASHNGKANSAITIGTFTNQENVFDKMQYGTFLSSSNAVFQNNVFQNIKSTIAPRRGALNAAIMVSFLLPGGVGPFYTKVGGSTGLKNTFKDNDYGVANVSRSHLSIEYNRFEKQSTGVFVTFNNNYSTVNVASNKFINNKIGINFNQNININATIAVNWMDNNTAQGTYADNYAIRCTEAVPPTNTTNYAKYDIDNNYINGYYNGVHTSQTFNSIIKQNEVHMRAQNTTGNFQSGIWINNTNNNTVEQNIVNYPNGTSGNWWQYNIFTAGSTLPKIHCNSTNYGGVGIIANGPNLTVAGDGFRGNSMANHGYGFWLNASGEIGDQYYTAIGTNYSADNTWTNCVNETFVNSGCNLYGGTGAKFYTRSTNPYRINSPRTDGGNLLLGTNNSAGFTGACYVGSATPTLNLRVMQKAPEIAKGTFTFADHDVSLKQITRKQLYGNLALQEIDPSYNPDVNDFANISRHAALGQFFVVDSLINTGDTAKLNIASSINSSVYTTNDVDATQQEFNTLYINHLKNKRIADATEVAAFETIAWLCPTINGHAVYQARSVLFNITQKQYINACEKGDGNSSHRFANAIIKEAAVNVKLFPNPSNGNITLQTNDDLSYNIIVYNLLGEKVFESNTSHNQSIHLNYLSSATYIVHIHQNGNLIKTERVSIIH